MNEPNGRYESTSNESSDGSHSSGEANIPSKNCPLNGHISANVVSSEIFDGDGKKFTVYKMSVSCGGHRWQVDRRYNEFRELVSNLKRIYPTFVLKLPGKKLFGNNFKSDFIRSRRQGLDEFVQGLCSDPQLCSEPEVQAFFKVSIKGSGNTDGSDGDEEPMVIDSAWSDGAVSGNEKGEERAVNLGPTEKIHMKPSDFEFLKVIGKGSFGKVMLARHRTENKTYAVKVLQKKMIIKRNEKTHIMCERNVLLKNLNHPFLVGLHYSFQTRDKLYFVLDYLNGGELFFHLQRETYFAEPRARFYAAEITSALGYLHSHGIVYRDLKPENLLLDSEGHVVLTDFGLCKDGLRERDTTTTFCGTPEYLAPEVLRKEAYDRTVDWWCLGAVLYEMLYGLPPFYSRDTAEMYENILHKPIRLRTNISLAARSILEGLLQKDKRRRLGAQEDINEVKQHEFFKLINWHDLETKNIPPPFNPNVKGCLDLKNIDPEFTREPVPASVMKSPGIAASNVSENAFQGFSYQPTHTHQMIA